ncbi:UNVERIFIED_CONTAM: hypothetical protein HHA_452010 [Hammondia hammondi]|eukprot:XP_008884997.1 hypothetical protein HHA_452010 [Hammondia hammondi]
MWLRTDEVDPCVPSTHARRPSPESGLCNVGIFNTSPSETTAAVGNVNSIDRRSFFVSHDKSDGNKNY